MRNALAVVIGLVAAYAFVIAAFVIVAFTLLSQILVEGSFDAKPAWSIASLGLGLIGAMIGGMVCKAIARNSMAPVLLVIVMLALGAAAAVPKLAATKDETPQVRTPDMPCSEVLPKLREPTWVTIFNPMVGVVGVLLGARLVRGRDSSSTA